MHLETSMHPVAFSGEKVYAALSNACVAASLGIAVFSVLEKMLPAAGAAVEKEASELSGHFTVLANYVNTHEIPPRHIATAAARIVVGMQFQDRNTQVMQDAARILKRYRYMLEEMRYALEDVCENGIAPVCDFPAGMNEILSGIRLNEMRTMLTETLANADIFTHLKNLLPGAQQDTAHDTELF